MATVRIYDQSASADPHPVVQIYDQSAESSTSTATVRIYDQSATTVNPARVRIFEQTAVVGSGSTASVRIFEQSVTTVPYVGAAPGPMWHLNAAGSWEPWRPYSIGEFTGPVDTGPGTGGGLDPGLLAGNLLDVNTQSLETDASGWSAGEQSDVRSKDGNHALRLITGVDGTASTTTVAHIAVTPAANLSAQYWAYTEVVGVSAQLTLKYYNSSDTLLATRQLTVAPTVPTAGWSSVSFSDMVPSSSAYVTKTVTAAGPVGAVVYADRFYLGTSAPATGITFRAASTAAVDAGAGNLIMATPAGTQAGDLLVFFVSSAYPVSSVSFSPAGWTLAGAVSRDGNSYMWIYWRRATGSEPATHTIVTGTGQSSAGWMGAFTGVIATDPPVRLYHSGSIDDAATSTTCPAAGETQAGDFALHMAGTSSSTPSPAYSITTPSTWTQAGAPLVSTVTDVPGVAAVVKLGATGSTAWSTPRGIGTDWATASLALIGATSTPGGGSPPATPTGLAHGTATSNAAPYTWGAVAGATSYPIYVGGSLVASPTGTSYTVGGLAPSTTYSVQVSAVNAYGESAKSTAVTVTTTSAGTLPAAPTGLTVGTVTASSVALSWSAVSGVTSYPIYRGGVQIATTTATSYTATGLTASTPYTFQVSAINSVGESAKSSSVSATTSSSGGTGGAVFFAARSPINTLIPSSATVASNSSTLVTSILRTKNPLLAWGTGSTAGGTPVYIATSSTPRFTVTPAYAGAHGSRLPYWPLDAGDTDWGPNPFAGRTIPWDSSWTIPGSVSNVEDDKWVAIQDTNGLIFELWMTTFNYGGTGGLECWWGGISDVNTTNGQIQPIAGKATGANISTLAGTILLSELDAGVIPHALTCSGDWARNTFVYPASASDGGNSGTQYPPEGSRLRLSPSYNIAGDTSLLAYERIIAVALQNYGAYLVDNGGEGTTFGVHKYPSTISATAVRTKVGIPDAEWITLDHIKWATYLQVLTPAANPGYF